MACCKCCHGPAQAAGRLAGKNLTCGLQDLLLHPWIHLIVPDQKIGEIRAENWRAWNFSIVDVAGQEVARITKTWEGLAKTMFTTADNYVLDVKPECQGPLRWLVFASAVSVDLALKQDSRGLS